MEPANYCYLYGIARDPPALACDGIAEGALVAMIERVPRADFHPDVLEERLKSIAWVGPQARKHDGVLLRALQNGPVVPARLCTLFSDEAAVRAFLVQNQQRLLATLDRLAGRQEWSLKVYLAEPILREQLAARTPAADARPSSGPGQTYVMAKQREAALTAAMDECIDAVLDEILAAVAEVVCDSREKSLLSAESTGQQGAMVLNIAVLLDTTIGLQDTCAALADKLAADGFRLELSGPWPPYSFTGEDDAHVLT